MTKEPPSTQLLRNLFRILADQHRVDHADLQAEVARERRQREQAESTLSGVLESKSWRLTAPLRRFIYWMRGPDEVTSDVVRETVPPETEPGCPKESETALVEQTISEIASEQSPTDLIARVAEVRLDEFLASGDSLVFAKTVHPEVSILLVLFNRAELTLACLRSLLETGPISYEVVIVDNASTDETTRLLARIQGATLIHNENNIHFLRGVNLAAGAARGRNLLILNNDTELLPGALAAALTTLNSGPDIGAVGGKLILPDGRLQEAGSIIWRDGSCLGYARGADPMDPTTMFRRAVDYCSAAFLLTPKEVFDRMGGFDTLYEPAYYEETDYCMRLWEHGLRVIYEPLAALLHHEFASSSSIEEATDLHREHQQVFVEKHRESLKQHRIPGKGAILEARIGARAPSKKVLFIDDRVPDPGAGSGFGRSYSILCGIVDRGYTVTAFPTASDQEWSEIYRQVPREVEVMLGWKVEGLEHFLEERNGYYDTILIRRPHNMKALNGVRRAHPDWFLKTEIVYDAEALFSLREIGNRKVLGQEVTEREQEKLIREEIDLAALADVVVSISERERNSFVRNGLDRVQVLGHAVSLAPTSTSFEDRSGLLFVGVVDDEAGPRDDSLVWFLEEVWPHIRETLGTTVAFTIAGVNRAARVQAMASDDIRILDPIKDMAAMYAAHRVFVATTHFGAGILHRIHEAAAYGLPVVTTPLLAGQLEWEDRMQVSVADGAEAFAKRAIELYEDQALWESIRSRALEQVQVDCSTDRFDAQLDTILRPRIKGSESTSAMKPVAAGHRQDNG